MIVLLSPSKTLDFRTPSNIIENSQPRWLDDSAHLVNSLRSFSPAELASLMGISDKLAMQNYARYSEWSLPFTPENAKQAVLAFSGDVYEGLEANTLGVDDLSFAQGCLRILSGLYGLLRPLDYIQAYRLEMGSRLANRRGRDLYAYWGNELTNGLNKDIKQQKASYVVNLASEEYFKVLQPAEFVVPLIQPVFEDWKNGRYKIISFYAKRARGLMARYIVRNRLQHPADLQAFDLDGYCWAQAAGTTERPVFRRN